MPSLGSDRSLNAKLYQETGKVEYVTQYSVFNDKTGQTTYYDTYQGAADYMNSIGGSAMDTAQYQATVRQSGGAVTAVYEDGRQVDLQNNKVQDEVLLNQNKANATGESAAPVSPTTDPQAGSGEQVANPVSASDVKYSAKDLDALAAANGVDAGDVDTEVGIVEAQLYRDEATARGQSEVSSQVIQAENQETNQSLSQQMPANTDWRVTLRLAPGATYLYKAADAGLLQPLKVTNGVIFPYTPAISTAYRANYNPYDLTHSNYRGYFYQNSYTDAVSLKATYDGVVLLP